MQHFTVEKWRGWTRSFRAESPFFFFLQIVMNPNRMYGGITESEYDGNPGYFFSPNFQIEGPQWVSEVYKYGAEPIAGCLWCHDHTLGITRLNVYAGMAGFFIVRDDDDTGKVDNPLVLPVFRHEAAYAIRDRMFKEETGASFIPPLPAIPGTLTSSTKKVPNSLLISSPMAAPRTWPSSLEMLWP